MLLEKEYIKKLDSLWPNGMNSNKGGGGGGSRIDYSKIPEDILNSYFTIEQASDEILEGRDADLWRMIHQGRFRVTRIQGMPPLLSKTDVQRYKEFKYDEIVDVGKDINGACALYVNELSAAVYLRKRLSIIRHKIKERELICRNNSIFGGKKAIYVPSVIYNEDLVASKAKEQKKYLDLYESAKFLGVNRYKIETLLRNNVLKTDGGVIKKEDLIKYKKEIKELSLYANIGSAMKMLGLDTYSLHKLIESGDLITKIFPGIKKPRIYIPSIIFYKNITFPSRMSNTTALWT